MTEEESWLPDLVRKLRREIVWKPTAASRHLLKRKLRGHLPTDSSLLEYETIIRRVLEAKDASIYVYYTGDTSYLAVAARLDGRLWLVIASYEGVLETAFVVENPESYLEREVFRYVGKMDEVVR
jgi:hypothetical protein